MNASRSLGFLVAASFVALAGLQLSGHVAGPKVLNTAVEQSPDEIRLSSAISFALKTKQYLSKSVMIQQWSQVLSSADGRTICLAYVGVPSTPGVAIFSGGSASRNPEDWGLKCSAAMFDLTREVNLAGVAKLR